MTVTRDVKDSGETNNTTRLSYYELRSTVSGRSSDASDVSVFDMKGNRVPDKTWKEKLKTDQHVLLPRPPRIAPTPELRR